MKKLFLFSTLAVILSLGFTSCRKCQICTRSASPEIRICDKDYDSNTQYGLAIDALEATGYNCR